MIVVGAGPAGASAALVACGLGLRVALVDKARFPRDKLCGGGLTGRCWGHLGAVYGALPGGLFHEISAVRLVAEGEVIGVVDPAPPVRMVMRRDFDAALVARAVEAGAEDLTGTRVAGLDLPGVQVTLADGRVLRGRVLIGADGVNSAVARELFGRAYDPGQIGFGLEVEAPHRPETQMELDLTAARWGYGWVFPKPGSLTIGVGGVAARNGDMTGAMRRYLARHGVEGARIKGHHLPFGDPRPAPGRGAVLLAGDAAGFVDPVTGEGIGWAIRSGQLAAEAAAAAIAAEAPEGAFARYDQATGYLRRELGRARRLRGLVYHPWLQRRFLRLMARDVRLQRRYLSLLAGEMDYADIGWHAVPRLVMRMLRRGRG